MGDPEVDLKLSTVLGQKTITSKKVTGLTVRGVKETTEIILPRTYTRNVIPTRCSQIPRQDTTLVWPYLESIASHLMSVDTEAKVGLLIGANCARAIKHQKNCAWLGIIGEINQQGQDDSADDVRNDVFCNCIVTCEVQQEIQATSNKRACHFALKTQVKEVLS